jgi:dipeptidyl aminopeptidase/acylaminoacyl peptidase
MQCGARPRLVSGHGRAVSFAQASGFGVYLFGGFMTSTRFVPLATFLLAAGVLVSAAGQGSRVPQRPAAAPETKGGFALTVDSIMRGPKLVGYEPTGLRWSADSRELYFEWRRPQDEEAATWVVARDGGEPRKLTDEERRKAPPVGGTWDRARGRVLFVEQGDVVLFDAVSRTRRQITRTTGAEASPRWARNETAVTFVRDNNLFVVPLDTGAIEQLTDVQARRQEPRDTEAEKFVKAEEQKLITYTREQTERRKKDEEKRKKDALPVFEIAPPRQSVQDLMLSPDNEHVFLMVTERGDGAKQTVVPSYVTESGYTEDISARTKVGEPQDRRRLAILNVKTGKSVWADAAFAGKAAAAGTAAGAPGAADAAGAMQQAQVSGQGPAKAADREVRWSMPLVSADGKFAVAWVRSADNKDRWIVALDGETGKSRVLDTLHDEAWVNESGGGWLPDDHTIYFTCEADGWAHLYTLDAAQEGARRRQLTSGKFEVSRATLSPDRKRFYVLTSEKHLGERHIYAMALEGGARTALTSMTGSNAGEASPDDSTFGLVYSYSNKPPELYLMPNRPGALARQVTTTPTEEWRSFKWADPQVLTFKARDGVEVYARLFTPEMVGARRDPLGPGVVFVHGAGYAQNAHKYWASYFREYMFHNLLASRGYVVLDVDYRASSGYGREWRTAIYRHMGGKDLDDIVDGAKYLVEKQKVNARRIGVYGGSYGGFITLMAMFTSPDTFTAGAALRPVTDWAHYNHGYTANILNEPQADGEAYRRSSPIYFADGLKGALLICHGLVDTNVHAQDTMRLVQRLIELRKENWNLAVFPVENHGFEQETSWADEYKRILKLFEDRLRVKKQTT